MITRAEPETLLLCRTQILLEKQAHRDERDGPSQGPFYTFLLGFAWIYNTTHQA